MDTANNGNASLLDSAAPTTAQSSPPPKARKPSKKGKKSGKGKKGESGLGKVVRIADQLAKDHEQFRTEWAEKFNLLSDRVQKFVVAVGQQIAGLSANQQIHSNVLEQLDINIQAVDRTVREVYGRFEQVDAFLQKAGYNSEDLTQEELASIKEAAQKAYEDTMQESFRQVHEARNAAIKAQREAAKKAKEEAEEQAKNKAEAERAEQELQAAEKPSILAESDGQDPKEGPEYPKGAEIFGG